MQLKMLNSITAGNAVKERSGTPLSISAVERSATQVLISYCIFYSHGISVNRHRARQRAIERLLDGDGIARLVLFSRCSQTA